METTRKLRVCGFGVRLGITGGKGIATRPPMWSKQSKAAAKRPPEC